MLFFLRRMRYRIAENRAWFLLAILLPLFYLGVKAYQPDHYTVSLSFAAPDDAPVAMSGSPTDSIPVSELTASRPFIKGFIKGNFFPRQILDAPLGADPTPSQIQHIFAETTSNLTFERTETGSLTTTYTGKDKELGGLIVGYYGNTMHRRIQEGYKGRNMPLPIQLEAPPKMDKSIVSSPRTWDPERTLPAFMLLVAGILAVLLYQLALEFLDPSFKSERQIAEHTRLPILGSLPDLNKATATPSVHPDM